MTNLKIYQICHNLITYFVTLTSPKKVKCDLYLGPEGVMDFVIHNPKVVMKVQRVELSFEFRR